MVKKKKEKSKDIDSLNLSSFILLNTLLLHEIIAKNDNSVKLLQEINKNYKNELLSQWKNIVENNKLGELFVLGLKIVKYLPNIIAIEDYLEKLMDLALDIFLTRKLVDYDILGRIYNKLLLKVKGGYYATYFTQLPAAFLLSNLIINTEHKDWDFQNKDFLNDFRAIDPACGSGTLLSALYYVLKNKITLDSSSYDKRLLHRLLLENILYGYDVIDYNIQLSIMTLAHHNPETIFQNHNLSLLPTGVGDDGIIHLGALDFLQNSVDHKKFDLIIMNPPFSRSAKPNIKFGYEKKVVKTQMYKKLSEITKKIGFTGIGQAGLGAYFIVLADKLLKSNGRIGIVIPRAILSGVSWNKIRVLLLDNYDIEYIISNFDLGNKAERVEGWNWSENTDLGEVLIIAKKRDKLIDDRNIFYINFWKKPRNVMESLEISSQIISIRKKLKYNLLENCWDYLTISGTRTGVIYKIPTEYLSINWHLPCVFSIPELNKFLFDLINYIPSIPIEQLISSSGRDIKQVKSHFKRSSEQTPYLIIFGHQSTMDHMYLGKEFIKYGVPIKNNSPDFYYKHKSNILIATRPHLTNDCIIAAEAEENVLATAFWEIKLQNDNLAPLVLLWLNSTFGFMLTIAYSTSSKAQTYRLKKGQLKFIPIPKKYDLKRINKFYNQIKNEKFNRFSVEFKKAADGLGIRKKIDDFFLKELNLNYDLKHIYERLSIEPTINITKKV
ncbi:MAG: N-6 DNA methylase [Candidatus Helarchaeota archaeon]